VHVLLVCRRLIPNFIWVKNKKTFKIFKKLIFNFNFIASQSLNFISYFEKKIKKIIFFKEERETRSNSFFSIGPRPKFPTVMDKFPHRNYFHSHLKDTSNWKIQEVQLKIFGSKQEEKEQRILMIRVFSRSFLYCIFSSRFLYFLCFIF